MLPKTPIALGLVLAMGVAGAGCGAATAPGDPDGLDASAGPSAVCPASPDASSCLECCAATYPAASLLLVRAALTCACEPAYCGPVGGGAPSGESGFGQGACSDACSLQALPSTSCTACVTATVQGTGLPPCLLSAATSCLRDEACTPAVACAVGCGVVPGF